MKKQVFSEVNKKTFRDITKQIMVERIVKTFCDMIQYGRHFRYRLLSSPWRHVVPYNMQVRL